MSNTEPRTRIFLSCGQTNDKEKDCADKIKKKLERKGFEVYLADLEHTNKDVMRAVLGELKKSEYFLLIDFRREKLYHENRKDNHRGSLFTQQELAIATFHDITQLRFMQNGVILEGIAKYLQGRPIRFDDHKELFKLVDRKIKQWRNDWKNCLFIKPKPSSEDNIPRSKCGIPAGNASFWHLDIENKHQDKMALDCRVILKSIGRVHGKKVPAGLLKDIVEQKWAGHSHPGAAIPAKRTRRGCAFYCEAGEQGVRFHQFGSQDTDSAKAAQQLLGPGKYKLEYVVVSSNFPPISRKFLLTLTGKRTGIKLKSI